MRYEYCPKCEGRLGIPDKKRGKPIECPVCNTEFVPPLDEPKKKSKSKLKSAAASAKPAKPSIRSMPMPSAIKDEEEALEKQASTSSTTATSALDPPKPRLSAPGPPSPPKSDVMEVAPKKSKPKRSKKKSSKPKKEHAKPVVAKIIQTESVQPQIGQDGKLPTLQLLDDEAPKEEETKLANNPAFLGALICGSMVLSGLLLLIAGGQTEATKDSIENARNEIVEFYEVRLEEEPKPYQIDLREAQLAHSRKDYRDEVRSYQRVMRRFHSEDRNQSDDKDEYRGLTGLPSDDDRLQELVSTLLNEAKRLSKKAGR